MVQDDMIKVTSKSDSYLLLRFLVIYLYKTLFNYQRCQIVGEVFSTNVTVILKEFSFYLNASVRLQMGQRNKYRNKQRVHPDFVLYSQEKKNHWKIFFSKLISSTVKLKSISSVIRDDGNFLARVQILPHWLNHEKP